MGGAGYIFTVDANVMQNSVLINLNFLNILRDQFQINPSSKTKIFYSQFLVFTQTSPIRHSDIVERIVHTLPKIANMVGKSYFLNAFIFVL